VDSSSDEGSFTLKDDEEEEVRVKTYDDDGVGVTQRELYLLEKCE
jgi:hypothetical protein